MNMKKFIIISLSLFLTVGFITGVSTLAADDKIVIGEGNWPGIRAKNAVASVILENIGYRVEKMTARDPLIHQGLAQGDIDIYLGSWMPQISKMRKKYKGKYDYVTQNMTEGVYTMAVPDYIWKAGVRSHADLDKYADIFKKKIYVGPAGWASSKKMNEAIKKNIYDLGDWEAINSSQSALMSQMKKSINEKEWIVFVGWRPHWMNTAYDIKFLNDPQRLWESPYSWVDTLARKNFAEDYPEVYRFFQQFRVDVEDNNKWIYEIGYKKRDERKVAREWIKNNITKVRRWLSMVEAKNGQDAYAVLKDNLNIK